MRLILIVVLLCASGAVHAQAFGLHRYRDSCSRDAIELMFELSAAVESGDVNRIAAVYDWNGMGSAASRDVMDRLEAIADRTLVDVVPVYPPAPRDGDALQDPYLDLPAWSAPLVDRPPSALRVEQVVSDGATPVSTTFALRRRMGCWWVVL